jgi:hypothetical protein
MFNIFEYPFVGIGIAVISALVLWIFGLVRPGKKRRWHPLIPVGIIILSFAVSYFVRTDREKINYAFNKGVAAFELRQIEPIKEIVADDYSDSFHSSKDLLVAYCQALFAIAAIEKTTFLSRRLQIEDGRAVLVAEAVVKFTPDSEPAKVGKALMIIKARFYFKKSPGRQWLINHSEILELDRKQVNWSELRG